MATQFTVQIPEITSFIERYAAAPAKVKASLHETMKAAAITVQAIAMSEAPAKTGRLRSSIRTEAADVEARIFVDPGIAPYGIYVHEGTGLYGKRGTMIVPKNAKVLASRSNPGWGSAGSGGYFIIGKHSRGQKPNPFMKRAYDLGQAKVTEIFRQSVRIMVSDLSKGI